MKPATIVLAVALSTAIAPHPIDRVEKLVVPTFGQIVVYVPSNPVSRVVLFISGDGGWNLGVVSMARRLQTLDALVVGIDIRSFVKSLEESKDCAYPAGALEELSRVIQLRYHLPVYTAPVLVGYSSGATLVYAALAAAPPETFAGAISLGFCPLLEMRRPPCQTRGLKAIKSTKSLGFELAPSPRLTVPWMVLQGEIDQVCIPATTLAFVEATRSARMVSLPGVGHGFAVPRNWEPQFVEAYESIAKAATAVAPVRSSVPEVADLPLVEVSAADGHTRGLMAILLTGDGGWAEIDKTMAAGLAAAGVSTVGWSSLQYYWTPRTPEGAAADLERIITHYTRAWSISRVLLIGYSFGADVLPFLATRLSPQARSLIRSVTLLDPSLHASFEFHIADWFGGARGRTYETVPEIERVDLPVTCVHGTTEADTPCRLLKGANVTVAGVGSGHHFGGDYDRVIELVLQKTH